MSKFKISLLIAMLFAFSFPAMAGEDVVSEVSMAKYWITDLQFEVAHKCLQFFGGYGYMKEFPISRYFVDARVQSIYGGANEVMKELIARRIGLFYTLSISSVKNIYVERYT